MVPPSDDQSTQVDHGTVTTRRGRSRRSPGGRLARDDPPDSPRFSPDVTASLLDDIAGILRRYVIFRSEHEPYVLAGQILYTYLWEHDGDYLFGTTLYVFVAGKSGSAKTRLLELASELVRNPTPIGVRWTEANLFRVAQHNQVIFMDETHNTMGGPEDKGISSVLNAGSRLTGEVPRVNPKTGEIEWYQVFCPKWIAAREDRHSLNDDTLDRTVKIRLPRVPQARKTLGVRLDIAEFRRNEGAQIRERAEAWAEQARKLTLTGSDIPDELDDRTAEAWSPLFAICDLAGPEHGKRIREAALSLTGAESPDPPVSEFDIAVRIAMQRGFVSPSDYHDAANAPFMGENYGGLGKTDYGWNDRRKAFKHLSIYASDDRSVIQLRIPGKGQEFALFWQAVIRANNGSQLADAGKVLAELKEDGRLTPDGRKGYKNKVRVWKADPKQAESYTIDIRCWYENHDDTSTDESNDAMPNPWKEDS